MKRLVALVGVAALVLSTVVTLATPSTANHRGCHVTWGSLVKVAPHTRTGDVTDVRAGRHRCFDRMVVDVDGRAPGYHVRYVRRLRQDGSGDRVQVSGGAILRVIVVAPAHDNRGRPTIDGRDVDALAVSGFRTFRDVAWAGSFEGQTTVGIGVRARLPFRVFTLSGPGGGSRLVIDVAHRW